MVAKKDFKNQCKLPLWELSELTPSHLATPRVSYDIPNYIEMAPAGTDCANVHRPEYCTFYEYAFGSGIPINPLAEEFCRLYGACPAQLTPYMLKVCRILTTYAAKGEKEVTVHHLLQMFGVSFMRGSMIQLVRRGNKSFVAQTDDKASRKFWNRFFFMRIEQLVSNPEGFSEAWNTTCKHSST